MRFDLVDLRVFLNVAEGKSITRGAQRSNLTLPSASARIRGMEEVLGTELLIRGRDGVSLSPAGQCLARHARLIVQDVERMRGDLGAFARGLSGCVRLVSNTAAMNEHLPHVLAAFLSVNPTISVDVEERQSIGIGEAIASGAADVGIGSAAALPETLERFFFRDDTLVLVLPENYDLQRKRELTFADVIQNSFVALPRDSALQRHLAGHAARLGMPMNIRVRVNSFDAVCRLVNAGAGIGIVPETAAMRCRRGMKMQTANLAEPWAERQLAVCVRRDSAKPAGLRRLVEHLKRSARLC
jgi:DNA-binding transcriptional LysR family regulator